MEVKTALKCEYKGHRISAKGVVGFDLKSDFSDLHKVIQLTQLLGNDILVRIRSEGQKPFTVGNFKIKQLQVSSDGTSTIKMIGLSDFVNLNELNKIPFMAEDEIPLEALFKSQIETEGENEI